MLTDIEKLLRLLLKPDVQGLLLGPPGPPPNLDLLERGGDHVGSDFHLLLDRVKHLLLDQLEAQRPLANISITGPGGVITGPMLVMKRALIEHGYIVEVEDKREEEYGDFTSADDYLRYLKELNFRTPEDKSVIQIRMNHQPWGG